MLDSVMGVVGEIEREAIVANIKRGKAKRAALGYPSGGMGGPLYGFRKALKGDSTKYWAEQKDEADNLRFMYTWMVEMAETRDPRGSLRGLVRELLRRGSLTRAGKPWTSQTAANKLRNPLYCGKGKLNRWKTVHGPKTDEYTGETYDAHWVVARDPAETLDIGKDMVPILVDPELFEKVQQILDNPNTSSGRLARKDGHAEEATLLHSGFLRCAQCGHTMIRWWRLPTKEHPAGVPNYRCSTNSILIDACMRHSIRAEVVEDFALRAVARVLSDPEKIIALADASEQQMDEAHYVVLKATNDLEAMDALVAQKDTEITDTLAAIAALALSKIPGMGATVDELRVKLVGLNVEWDNALAAHARLAPRRDRADERAAFLCSLFAQRDKLVMGEWMPMEYARALLGEEPTFDPTNPVIDLSERGWLDDPAADTWLHLPYQDTPEGVEGEDYQAKRDFVVYSLLRCAPWARLRKLLRELDVVVRVSPPRGPEDRAIHGHTPAWERVTVQVGALEIMGAALVQADESGSPDGKSVVTSC